MVLCRARLPTLLPRASNPPVLQPRWAQRLRWQGYGCCGNQALFLVPDLLLLDEPTNHLDVHALTWLEEFLAQWDKTVVIVSHDRGFLNKCTTNTIFLHRKRLAYYGGSYDTFLKVDSLRSFGCDVSLSHPSDVGRPMFGC